MRKALIALLLLASAAACGGGEREWVHARTNEGILVLVPQGTELHPSWSYVN